MRDTRAGYDSTTPTYQLSSSTLATLGDTNWQTLMPCVKDGNFRHRIETSHGMVIWNISELDQFTKIYLADELEPDRQTRKGRRFPYVLSTANEQLP